MELRPELYYKLSDRWFRIMEFSLILGTLRYFFIKTNNDFLWVSYWISYLLFLMWSLELAEMISIKIYSGNKIGKSLLVLLLCSIPNIFFLTLIHEIIDVVVQIR